MRRLPRLGYHVEGVQGQDLIDLHLAQVLAVLGHQLEGGLAYAEELVPEDLGYERAQVEGLGCEVLLELEVRLELEEDLERVGDFEYVVAQEDSELMGVLRMDFVVVPVSVGDVGQTEERAGVLGEQELVHVVQEGSRH